jgi:heterodisulfide reductase subunit A-like polyferredoxin
MPLKEFQFCGRVVAPVNETNQTIYFTIFYQHQRQDDNMTQNQPIGSVMVVGGGISGMQSALDLANAGYYVHLVEQTPAIGGMMARLDKTFPTNDCSM